MVDQPGGASSACGLVVVAVVDAFRPDARAGLAVVELAGRGDGVRLVTLPAGTMPSWLSAVLTMRSGAESWSTLRRARSYADCSAAAWVLRRSSRNWFWASMTCRP